MHDKIYNNHTNYQKLTKISSHYHCAKFRHQIFPAGTFDNRSAING